MISLFKIVKAANVFDVQAAFLERADSVAEEVRRLLDPPNNFSLVSERRDCSAPAYFAHVFRNVAGCAPAECASNPRRLVAPGGGRNGRNGNHSREIVEFRR